MKIINEAKKQSMPVDFVASFISRAWSEVSNLKADANAVKQSFNQAGKVVEILQDLSDAYLIAIGQLEALIGQKGVEIPEKEEVKESLKEDLDEEPVIANPPEKVEKINDGEKVELHTELPDYDVEVEQKGDKVEVEVEPKQSTDVFNFDWPDFNFSDADKQQIENEKAAISGTSYGALPTGQVCMDNFATQDMAKNGYFDNSSFDVDPEVGQRCKAEPSDMFNVEFGDPVTDEDSAAADEAIKQWKNRHQF